MYVRTSCEWIHSEDKMMPPECPQADYVEVTMSDDGDGISDELMEKIFEPFVSTKGEQNAGLGLSIVKNILSSLDGTISCSNNDDRGVTFTIRLPIARKFEEYGAE